MASTNASPLSGAPHGGTTSLQTILQTLKHLPKNLWSGVGWIFTRVVGRLFWDPPGWVVPAGLSLRTDWRFGNASRRRLAIGLAAFAVIFEAAYWYVHLPTPHYVAYTVEDPGLTEYDENTSSIKPMKVTFVEVHSLGSPANAAR